MATDPLLRGAAALTALFALAARAATAQAPELAGLLPVGGPRGASTRVEIDGKNLQGATLFLSGRGATVKLLKISPAADHISAEIGVEPDAPLGPREMRIATAKGVTGGARFFVDVLPNRVIEKPMAESAPPEPIDPTHPAVINGRILSKAGRDRFLVKARAGEIWTFQCLADELRSRMDPVLELRDDRGVLLQLVQGMWESNPRFAFKIPRDGDYTLTVRDSEFNGGPNYYYRLLAGKQPLAAGYSPRGGRPGQTVDVALRGVNLPSERASIAIPRDAAGEYWAEVLSGSSGTLLLPLTVDSEPTLQAPETGSAMPLPALPVAIDGAFTRTAGARFTFPAAAGQKIEFDLLGRRIGSRIDGALRILDAAGKELASNDDAPDLGKDARLEFTAPSAGTYTVEARDVEEITGPDSYYRLRALPVSPDFQVSIATDRLTVPIAGTVVVPIALKRLGSFAGPVRVTCEGLPAGVLFRGGLFPPGVTAIEATLTAAPDAAPAADPVHLVATAAIGGRTVTHEAPAWERYEHRSIDLLLSVEYSYTRPHHLWDMLLLGLTDRTDPITISADTKELSLLPGMHIEIPVHVQRHPGAAGEVKVDVKGLPAKIAASPLTIAAGQTDGKLVITAAPDAAPASAGLILQGHLGNAVALAPAIELVLHAR